MTTTTPSPAHRTGCDTSDVLLVHQLFRRHFVDAPVLVRGVEPGDAARAGIVGAHVRELLDGLQRHHQAQDELLWGPLERRSAVCALHTGLMRAQHEGIARMVVRLRAVLPAWEADADAEGGEAVAQGLDEIRAALLAHLALEEERVLPTAADVMTQDEWDLVVEQGVAGMPRRRLLIRLGWMLDAMPEDARERWLRRNLPAPVRALWRAVGRPQFAAHRARVYGDAL